MAEPKSVYLVCGEDDEKISAWRARMRTRAESEGGQGALETFEGRSHSPGDVASALAALTFGTGTRYLLADGVEDWKPADLGPLEAALRDPAPDTVLVLIARGTPPERLDKAVRAAGGGRHTYAAPSQRELPKWLIARAGEQGLRIDMEAASALLSAVGPRPARLSRELEKLALLVHPRDTITAEEVAQSAAGETSARSFDLADALVDGDLEEALTLAEELTALDERPAGLAFAIVRELRTVHRAAELLDAGTPPAQIARKLPGPPWKGEQAVRKARQADREALERAICLFADFELGARGESDLDDRTSLSLTLAKAIGAPA